jgi:hypothetical protein
MKRVLARLLTVGLLAAILLVPSIALAGTPLPVPADGQKVAIKAWNPNVYEYPVGSGTWFLDANVGNDSTAYYSGGVAVVSPHTSVQYLNDAEAVMGVETFDVPSNVMPFSIVGLYPTGYYGYIHHRLTLPSGANPTKTRLAIEVPTTDPTFPRYHYATAASTAVFTDIYWVMGAMDTATLLDGRVQFTLTAYNEGAVTIGPLRVHGSESYGPSTSNAYGLDSYEVVADEPAKAARLAPGESTTFTLRGLNATPATFNRFTPWNLWVEAEPLPSLFGKVSLGGVPISGATVTVLGYPAVTTAADGTYTVPELDPGSHSATYSRAGYYPQTIPVTLNAGTNTAQNIVLTTTASLTRSPSASSKTYRRKKGKAKYTLSATVKGLGGVPVGGVRVYLQTSKNGKTKWKNSGSAMTSSGSGKVARAFTSKKRSTLYYRWAVPSQAGVSATPKTSKQKIVVR